jgi:hypothetical protein
MKIKPIFVIAHHPNPDKPEQNIEKAKRRLSHPALAITRAQAKPQRTQRNSLTLGFKKQMIWPFFASFAPLREIFLPF